MIRTLLIYLSSFVGLFGFTYYLLSYIFLDKEDKKHRFAKKDLPSVSIIIPAYNEDKTIVRTIESALNLEYPKNKIEVLVIDDGSKDKTYSLAKSVKSSRLRVFTKENGGKATAMNFALKKVKGDFVVTMDADTYAEPDALEKMMHFFANPKVMCVTPSMVVHKPKGMLQRIQQVEYLLGVFLRKAFSAMASMHVTPGAFSAYRKTFFDKHGGFDVDNITEDMEMALRVQVNHYLIQCSDKSVVYTTVPNKFKAVLAQRKRWYYGWIYNFIRYKRLFSKKYGQMGVVVLPVALTTILFSIILTLILVGSTLLELKKQIDVLGGVNFDFKSSIELNKFVLEKFIFILFSDPVILILLLFITIMIFYMIFAKTRVKKYTNSLLGMIFFILFYSVLYSFWWLVSAFYYFVIKKISWGKK